jgi:hypothetical protein
MSLSTHTLVSASLLRVSYSLSVPISTAIALTAMWLVLRLIFQLMAQSTFDERLVHLSDRCDNVIACMQQSRRVSLSYSTHIPIAIILLSHFIATVKRLTVFVECYQRIEDLGLFHLAQAWGTSFEKCAHSCATRHSGNARSELPE